MSKVDKALAHVYGVLGIFGTVMAVYYAYAAYEDVQTPETLNIFIFYSCGVGVITFMFITLALMYDKKVDNYRAEADQARIDAAKEVKACDERLSAMKDDCDRKMDDCDKELAIVRKKCDDDLTKLKESHDEYVGELFFETQEKLNNFELLSASLEDAISCLGLSMKTLHNYAHDLRYITKNIDDFYALEKNGTKESKENFDKRKKDNAIVADKFAVSFLAAQIGNIKTVMDAFTGYQCCVTLKRVIVDGGERLVETIWRDHVSYRSRKSSDYNYKGDVIRYRIEENTAFATISDPTKKENLYACDDLKSQEKHYNNGNPSWQGLYNATVVLPVCRKTEIQKDTREIIAFLCVDNTEGGFEDQVVMDYMSVICDSLFEPLKKYFTFKEGIKNL